MAKTDFYLMLPNKVYNFESISHRLPCLLLWPISLGTIWWESSSIYTCQLPIPPTYLTWNMLFLWMVRCQIRYMYFSWFCSQIFSTNFKLFRRSLKSWNAFHGVFFFFIIKNYYTNLELRRDNNVTCEHQFIPNIKKLFLNVKWLIKSQIHTHIFMEHIFISE